MCVFWFFWGGDFVGVLGCLGVFEMDCIFLNAAEEVVPVPSENRVSGQFMVCNYYLAGGTTLIDTLLYTKASPSVLPSVTSTDTT